MVIDLNMHRELAVQRDFPSGGSKMMVNFEPAVGVLLVYPSEEVAKKNGAKGPFIELREAGPKESDSSPPQ